MILYLLLIIAFGFLIVMSIGTLIFGLIKKRRKILLTAGILFIIGTLGCVFAIATYTKKAYDYVTSTEFQNDARKGAELIGKTAGSASSGISEGVSNTLDENAVDRLAHKSASIFGKVTKTLASNFDSTIGNTNIYMDSTLENSGIEPGRAHEKYTANSNDLGIFIDYKKDFKGKLRITNYDQNGHKIDIVDKNVNVKAGQGKVEIFSFLHSDLGITTYYILSAGH